MRRLKMIKPISFLQTDTKWKNKDYSAKGEKTNIGESGCGPSCMAMVINSLRDPQITPVETCAWALKKGYKAPKQGTYYSYFKPQGEAYGLNVRQMNYNNVYGKNDAVHNEALNMVKAGHWIIACMGKGLWTRSGHFVLWYGMDGNNVLINDPNSTKSNRTKAAHSLFKSQVKYYFLVEVNTKPSISLIGEWSLAIKKGITDGSHPAKYITREQVIAMLYRAISGNGMAAINIAWNWAKSEGITDGSNPKANCTREQAIAMIYRATSGNSMAPIEEAWDSAIKSGMTDGSNPKSYCTREQLAAFIIRGLNV